MEGKKYNLDQALQEAIQIQKKIRSREASDYSQAEEQIEKAKIKEGSVSMAEKAFHAGLKNFDIDEVYESDPLEKFYEEGSTGLSGEREGVRISFEDGSFILCRTDGTNVVFSGKETLYELSKLEIRKSGDQFLIIERDADGEETVLEAAPNSESAETRLSELRETGVYYDPKRDIKLPMIRINTDWEYSAYGHPFRPKIEFYYHDEDTIAKYIAGKIKNLKGRGPIHKEVLFDGLEDAQKRFSELIDKGEARFDDGKALSYDEVKNQPEEETQLEPLKSNADIQKEKLAAIAGQEGSEEGPLGEWPRARLDQSPGAGKIIQVDGKWYVAVAGRRKEGSKGDYGGLYARWVQVPESECKDW